MILFLSRTYFPEGTNGELHLDGQFICYTIELPWLNNEKGVSCIPEGEYLIRKRYSPKHHWHLEIVGVPNRKTILFHPANDALTELRGCIAPVLQLSGTGKGLQSRAAFQSLTRIVYQALATGESVSLVLTS